MLVSNGARWLGLLLVASLAACSCEDSEGLQGRSPDLQLTSRDASGTRELLPGPLPIAFGAVRVGQEQSLQVEVRNEGAATLVFSETPSLASAGASVYTLREVMTGACAGEAAPADPASLEPGACATITVVFAPTSTGIASDELLLRSNDPDSGDLRVPIAGTGTTPDAVVCVGDTCTAAGTDEITLDFGRVPLGGSVSKEITVRNAGDLPLELSPYAYTGTAEFTLAPEPAAVSVEAAAAHVISVTFSPAAGGPRTGRVELPSDDPDQARLVVNLVGIGDAGQLCVEPFPEATFGEVEVNTTATLPLMVSNCGTQAISLTEATLLTNGEFALPDGAVSVPRALEPGESFEVNVSFTPPSTDSFSARLRLASDAPGSGNLFVLISGRGVPPNICDLKAQIAAMDFGQTVVGNPKRADVVFRNDGYSACTVSAGNITIADGAGVLFRVVSLPPLPATIGPVGSQSALLRVGVEYVPADTTGPDNATLSVTPDGGTPVTVALSGTPVAEGTCQLEVLFPSDRGFFGRVLNFGAVRVQRRKEMSIQLRNRGAAACSISSVTKANILPLGQGNANDFSITTLPGALPFTVPSGQQVSIGVSFRPQGEILYDPTVPEYAIRVQTNDGAFNECTGFGQPGTPGCMQVGLAGEGVNSVLEIVPDRLSFGEVTVGCASRERAFTVYNLAAQGMQITDIAIDPPGAPFVLVSRPLLPIAPFDPGMQFTVTVKYRPPDAQSHSAQVLVTTDDGNGNTDLYAVPLDGSGTFESHQTDTFQTPTRPKTDVLWIVDNSGSMSEEQGLLDDNARTFVGVASAVNADFRMALITTDTQDGSQNGKFQGNPKVIDVNTADPAGTLGSRFGSLGTNGSGDERGLAAAVTALSEPLVSDPAQNANFLRTDAKLAVIVVSDEEDGSNGDLDFYEDFFWNIKGRRNTGLFTFNAVVGDDPGGCTSANGDATAGARYVELVRRTGGIFQSICGRDWGQIASNLGLDVFTPIAEFRLTREADAASLVVTVDGAAQAIGTDFSYDAVSNSVIFTAGNEPGPGQTVVVDYDTYCGP